MKFRRTMAPPYNRDPGWKLDPKNDERIRYWTGKNWDMAVAPAGEHAETYAAAELGENVALPLPPNVGPTTFTPKSPMDPAVKVGWGLAILLPPLGFLYGLALLIRGENAATSLIIGSIVAAIAWYGLWDLHDLM